MSDYELDPIDPRDPEYEYAPPSWQLREEGSYRTGSTTPPKDYGGVVAAVLIVVIFFSGLSSALSMLNIRLFQNTDVMIAPKQDQTITFAAVGPVTSGLEVTEPTGCPEGEVCLEKGEAQLQITDTPLAADNISMEGALSWQEVYARVIQSTVSITTISGGSSSSGSGVIMNGNGYIITNAHVVQDADSVSVLLTDGRTLPARIVGSDAISDLAVLYVEETGLTPAEFGSSATLRVGDEVVAIGDPLGIELRGTMTDGIISAINRDIKVSGRTMNLIQTSAALNAGNSGGPLVNCYGQVIGINTMKIGDYASSAGVEGLGFAIPVSTVKEVVDQLIAKGYVSGRPTLGIEGEMVSTFYQYYYLLPAGMIITSIDGDSDAAAKGIQTGDIILVAAGRQISSTMEFDEIVNTAQVGDQITVLLYRGGREYSVVLTVTEAKK